MFRTSTTCPTLYALVFACVLYGMLSCLGSCSTARPDPAASQLQPEPQAEQQTEQVPRAGPAFDPLDRDAIWSAGDEVEFEIVARTGGQPRRWTARLSLPALPVPLPGPHQPDPVTGRVRTRTAHMACRMDLDSSLVGYTSYHRRTRLRVQVVDRDNGRRYQRDLAACATAHVWQLRPDTCPKLGVENLLNLLFEVDCLTDLLMDVVRQPGLLSVLGHGGTVRVTGDIHSAGRPQVTERDTPFGRVPTFWLPLRLFANGEPALHCRLLMTWKCSPLHLCAGILRIEACHPDEPAKRLTARLVRARRGAAPAPGLPHDLGTDGLEPGMSRAEVIRRLGWTVIGQRDLETWRGEGLVLVSFRWPGRRGIWHAAFEHDGLLYFARSPGQVDLFLRHRGQRYQARPVGGA